MMAVLVVVGWQRLLERLVGFGGACAAARASTSCRAQHLRDRGAVNRSCTLQPNLLACYNIPRLLQLCFQNSLKGTTACGEEQSAQVPATC
jgi:hypothetical protein